MEKGEKKQVLSGFLWKLAERISSQGVTLLVSIILARILLPEEYGLIAMVQVFIIVANVFVVSGFSTALIQKKDADNLDFTTITYISLIFSIILYIFIYIFSPFLADFYNEPQLVKITRVYSVSLLFSSYNSVQQAWVSRHMVFKKFFYSTLSGAAISGVIGIVLAYRGYGVWALIYQALVNLVVNICVLQFVIKWRPSFSFSYERAKPLIKYGWKILSADLVGQIYNQLRQLLIGKYYSSSDLAYFNRGKQFPEIINNNIDSSIGQVLFPAMSNYSDNPLVIKQFTRRAVKTTSYIMFYAMTMLAIIAEPLIRLTLTDKWLDCVPYLQLICIAKMIITVSTANLQALKAVGRSDIVLKLEIIKKPIGILMILIAMPISVLAISITVPLYSIYSAIINMSPNRKILGYSFKEQMLDLAPATFLSLGMFVICILLTILPCGSGFLMLLQLIVGTLFYFVCSYMFNAESFTYCFSLVKIFKR